MIEIWNNNCPSCITNFFNQVISSHTYLREFEFFPFLYGHEIKFDSQLVPLLSSSYSHDFTIAS